MNGTIYMPVGEVCSSISDTYREKKNMVTLINTSDVLEGRVLNHERVPNSNLKGQFKKTFQRDDILYSEIRPQNRRFAYVDFSPIDYIASTKLMVIRAKKDVVSPKYLYYFLKNSSTVAELQLLAETRSGTFPQITFSEVANLTIPVPSLAVQEVIVQTMQCLEDKITCNEQINDNLQQQAMALYAEMFLNSSDNNVTSGTLSDIAVITMGQSPSGNSYNEDGVGEVFYQGRAEFGFRFPKRRLFTTEPKRMAETGDVLLSVRAPVGDLNVAYESCCIGRGLGAIHSKTGHSSFVLYTMFALKSQLDVFNGEGTVFGSINRDALNAIPIDVPLVTKIDRFEAVAHPIDELIRTNYEENCRLEAIRDSLLPKLMSGEIDVSAVQL
jgi:type I restriction enzyme S subunit